MAICRIEWTNDLATLVSQDCDGTPPVLDHYASLVLLSIVKRRDCSIRDIVRLHEWSCGFDSGGGDVDGALFVELGCTGTGNTGIIGGGTSRLFSFIESECMDMVSNDDHILKEKDTILFLPTFVNISMNQFLSSSLVYYGVKDNKNYKS